MKNKREGRTFHGRHVVWSL